MAKNKKGLTPMEKLTTGYENFIKGKESNNKEMDLFNKVVKKSAKLHGSK